MEVTRLSEGSDQPTVLIGFAEAMAAIETTWSLQKAGFRVIAFHRAGTRPALRAVRGVVLYEVPPPDAGAAETIAAVSKLCQIVRPAAMLPLDDYALWVCRHLDNGEVLVAGGIGEAIDCALDKSVQIQAAAKAGLPVLPTSQLDEFDESRQPEFPVMIKPALALYEDSGKLVRPSGFVCGNAAEFARAAAWPWPGKVLVQPLIHGVGEGIFGHMTDDGVVGWSAHRRVRMVNPQGSASSACESRGPDKDLIGSCEQFLRGIGWRGLFMLEFLRDADGTPWFMELNGRAWGSMALARRRGFEYPAWTVQAALNPAFRPMIPAAPPEIRCRNLGLELTHLVYVARGPQSDAQVEWPKLSQAIRDVCTFRRGDRLYNWSRSQPVVLAADIAEVIRTFRHRMIARRS